MKAVKATEGVLAVSFVGLSTVSVIFLSTVIASPAVTVIDAVSLGAGLLFIVGGFVSRRLILKAEKHHKIKLLADKKLNVIAISFPKLSTMKRFPTKNFLLCCPSSINFSTRKRKFGWKRRAMRNH